MELQRVRHQHRCAHAHACTQTHTHPHTHTHLTVRDFPGCPVARNLSSKSGDVDWSLVQKDSTCHLVTKAVYHNYWVHPLELVLHNKRIHCNEKPMHRNWRKPTQSNKDPAQPKINNFFLKLNKTKQKNTCPLQASISWYAKWKANYKFTS